MSSNFLKKKRRCNEQRNSKKKKVHVIFIDRQYWMGCIIVLVDLNMILSKKCKKDW